MNRVSYLITDPRYYSNSSVRFKKTLLKSFKNHNVTFAMLRDKKSKNIFALAKSFLDICKKNGIKAFINSDIEIAYKLKFDGVHLPSYMIDKIKYAKRKKLLVIVSTHNFKEIKKAQKLGVDIITYSPIFFTPNKSKPKGVNELRKAILFSKIPIIALGGIVKKEHINRVFIKNAYGFASIRYFVNSI